MINRLHFFSLALLFGVLVAAGLAFADGTAANERITNVATATYNDSAGDPQTTTSNPVTTIVQQVYNFTITPNGADEANPGQTETALPGAPIYFNYTVTNTGNGLDTIDLTPFNEAATDDGGTAYDDDGATAGDQSNFDLTGLTIYRDTGCDGSVAGDSTITDITLDADESACIIIAGTIPGTATDGQVANANIYGVSQGDGTVTDENNWARAEANTAGNLTGNKVANPASGTPVAAGGTISYTITGSNNGGSAAYGVAVTYEQSDAVGAGTTTTTNTTGIFIQDVLDTDVSYTAASLSGTAGAGTVVPVYRDDTNGNWYDEEADVPNSIDAVGMIIVDPAPISAFFPQTANYSMSFSVTVNSGTTATTPVNNSATINYDTDNNGGNGTSTTTTNTTNNPVAATYSVKIGPDNRPEEDLDTTVGDSNTTTSEASYTDPASGDTWNVSLDGDGSGANTGDTQTITDTVLTGDTVAFRHTVKNTGNANDSFDITAASASGYTVALYQADGVSPLLGSVGPLAPGGELDIVVKVNVSGTTGDTVTVTATSTTSGSATDISTDVIPTPVNRAVDLATYGESNDGDAADDDPANQTATPGDTLTYPIEVTNTGNAADTYDITENLPAGWTVQYFPDTNCDGDADDGGAEAVALADPEDTGSIAAGATACFVAVVTVDAGATNDSDPGTTGFQPYDIDFTVTSQTNAAVTDTISTQVEVQVADIEFISNQTATTSPDSTVTYTHTLINNGNAAASVDIPAQSGTAFTYQYAVDTDGDGDFSDETFTSSLSGVAVAASDTETIFVRVVVPDTAVDGDTETVTVEARAAGTATVLDSVQDTTIVQAGELDLVKSAQTCITADCSDGTDPQSATGATAEPGDYLEYTVVASNIGSGNLTNVKVSDPLPAFTDFASVSATSTATGTILYSTDGNTWTVAAPGALTAGQTVYVAVDTNGSGAGAGAIDTNDVLAPGETITLTFVVQVQ